jgi:hypothetical protein
MSCVAELSLLNARFSESGRKSINFTSFLVAIEGVLAAYQTFPSLPPPPPLTSFSTSSIGHRKVIRFDAILPNTGSAIKCHVGCEGFGIPTFLFLHLVGCEVQESFQPTLNDSLAIFYPLENSHSVVTRQPSVSELVQRAMRTSQRATPEHPVGKIDEEIDVVSAIDSAEDREKPRTSKGRPADSMQLTFLQRKRKPPAEDGFSDVEIEEIDLDEDELRKLDSMHPPQVTSTRTRCNHSCKDRMT